MDTALQNRIFDCVDGLGQEMTDALARLVRIPSVTPEFGWQGGGKGMETEVNRHTKAILEEMGAECELFEAQPGRANLCARYRGAGGGRSLLFNGHVDVVPPGNEAEWGGNNPFSGLVENGQVHGRGAVDMKGGNIAAVFALKALQKAGVRLKGDLVFQQVVGEECKANKAGTSACLKRGYTADAAVVCEPTCREGSPFMMHPASVGVLEMKWKVSGKSCHVGMRREVIRKGGAGAAVGVDAIEKGMLIYTALKELETRWGETKRHPLYPAGQFCLNAATVKGGVAPSFVPPDMEMSYAILYPPASTAEEIRQEVEQCVHSACRNDPWLQEHPPEITWIFDWPPFDTNPEDPFCRLVRQAAGAVTPGGGRATGFVAVCDASFIRQAGIPVVVLGPGDAGQIHSAAEQLPISQLLDAAKIYALTMALWCGLAE